MRARRSKFSVGELIQHRLFHYRGVIIDVDAEFQGSEDWYHRVAQSKPPKDEPWYRVLVHRADHQTYVAERNIARDLRGEPIEHPMLKSFFDTFDQDGYHSKSRQN